MNAPVPDWRLERYALGELPPDEASALERRLAEDTALAARLDALRADDRAFAARYPAEVTLAAVRRRAAPANNARWYGIVVGAAAAAALAFVAVGSATVQHTGPDAIEATRIKGSARLVVLRDDGGSGSPLSDGASARPGDLLQLRYIAAGDRFGVVASVDGRGAVTVHLDDHGAAAPLDQDGAVALPAAFELDDAPRYERFYLVTSDAPFPTDAVRAALAASPDAPALIGLHVTTHTVRKP